MDDAANTIKCSLSLLKIKTLDHATYFEDRGELFIEVKYNMTQIFYYKFYVKNRVGKLTCRPDLVTLIRGGGDGEFESHSLENALFVLYLV